VEKLAGRPAPQLAQESARRLADSSAEQLAEPADRWALPSAVTLSAVSPGVPHSREARVGTIPAIGFVTETETEIVIGLEIAQTTEDGRRAH